MLEKGKRPRGTECLCTSNASDLKNCVNLYLGDLRLSLTLDKQTTIFFQCLEIKGWENADKWTIN